VEIFLEEMKQVLIFTAHPHPRGAANLLADEFEKNLPTEISTERIELCDANLPRFSQFFATADAREEKNMPPEILQIAKKWRAADSIAFFLPNWWGTGPAELVDLFCWLSSEIAVFGDGMPAKKMCGKKVFWVCAGAAPGFLRKLFFFKTDPEKWGRYIFSFSGAKFFSKFFNGAPMGRSEIPENWKSKIRKLAGKI